MIIWSAPAILTFMGAQPGGTLEPALAYIVPLFTGTIFFITIQMLSAILNAIGRTIPSRNFLMAGFFLNLLLNPWFIFGGFGMPAMGISGIAIATVAIQALGTIYIAWEVAKTDLFSWEIVRRNIRPSFRHQLAIFNQGFPTMLDLMGVSLGFFVLNYYVAPFGENALAALGSASRIEQLFLLPLIGLNIAVIALVSQNNGAGKFDRVQGAYRTSLVYGIGIMSITMCLALIFARPIMRLFTDTPEIIDIGVRYTRIRSLALMANAILFYELIGDAGYQKADYSAHLQHCYSLCRSPLGPDSHLYGWARLWPRLDLGGHLPRPSLWPWFLAIGLRYAPCPAPPQKSSKIRPQSEPTVS